MTDRDALGRIVRETWVEWAAEQREPKSSWLLGWDDLDDGQREVDCRIGEAVAAAVRERIAAVTTNQLLLALVAALPLPGQPSLRASRERWRQAFEASLNLIYDEEEDDG